MSMKGGKERKESKLSRYLKAPFRILIKARDFYVKSMIDYSDRIGYGTTMGCPAGQGNTFPRSYSVSSTKSSNADDDFRELIRAASTRTLDNKFQSELLRRQKAKQSPNSTGANNIPRSRSAAIGRIDEDKPFDFEEDINVRTDVFPRSRSYAVTKRRVLFSK